MQRLWFLPLLLSPLLALTGCDESRQPADLVLLYTGNINGYIEPCGCVAGQIGGIDRIAGYIEQERAALGGRGLFIDTGDLFAEGLIADANIRDQLAVKGKGLLTAWKRLGCDGLALGEAEVGVGIDVLASLAADAGLTILAGNVIGADGERPFAESLILERGGLKIGIFSLLGETMSEPKPKKDKQRLKRYDMVELLAEQGYTLEPWQDRAEALIAELRPKVDLLLCASHLGFNRNVELAEKHPELDLVFGGHFGSSEGQTTMVGNTPVVTNRLRGSRVGRMHWWLPEPDEYLAKRNGGVPGPLVDDSAYDEAMIGVEVSRQVYGELTGMERKYGTEEWQRKRDTQEAMYRLSKEDLAKLDPNPSGNRFSNNQVPMHHGIPRSSHALSVVDTYHQETHALWAERAQDAVPIPPEERHFKGSQACIECHETQYEFWLGTRHSRAFATLQATSQETDAECIGCHTIGYQVEGGFPTPALVSGYEDVQCAACHGAGAAHMSGGPSYLLPDLINSGLNGCARCHRDEHDPDFEQKGALKLPLVMCPPLAPPGATSPAMTAAYLEAAGGLKRRPRQNWDLISQAYASANEPEMALDAARRWVKEKPFSLQARLNLGDRALNINQLEIAINSYRIVTEQVPDDARAWTGLAWSLFQSDPERSLEAGREAYAIDPNSGMGARIVAMGLMAAGQVEDARSLMKRHLAFHPEQGSLLVDLLEQLPPEE